MQTPETLIASKLANLAGKLANTIDGTFAPLVENAEILRKGLLANGEIMKFPLDPKITPNSMAAIDGATVTEKMYAADLLVSAATVADARKAKEKFEVEPLVWANVLRHEEGSGQLLQTVRGSQEISLVAKAPHQFRIIDGGFVTTIIALREGLYVKSPGIRDQIADVLLGRDDLLLGLDPIQAFYDVITNTRGDIVALPKSDSNSVYVDKYKTDFNLTMDVSDRFLATQVLQPGEMLKPRMLKGLAGQEVREPEGSAKVKKAAAALREPVEHLATLAGAAGRVQTTYFKPLSSRDKSVPHSNTVIRIEFILPEGSHREDAFERAQEYAAIISSDIYSPHLIEPYSQWMVDRQAKAVSSSTRHLRERMISKIPANKSASYRALLASGYRT